MNPILSKPLDCTIYLFGHTRSKLRKWRVSSPMRGFRVSIQEVS